MGPFLISAEDPATAYSSVATYPGPSKKARVRRSRPSCICIITNSATTVIERELEVSSRPLSGSSPNLAPRHALWTLNLCRYRSRVLSYNHCNKRAYLAEPEMAVAKWSTSVISTLSSDTEPTIIITFDNAKYIFNAGENTGRAWIQSRSYWRKVRALFFTQLGTQRMSGMPGTVFQLTRF